jgi:hypothetical protein
MKRILITLITSLTFFQLVNAQEIKAELMLSKKPHQTDQTDDIKKETTFKPEDGIYGFIKVQPSFEKYLNNMIRLGLEFEVAGSKDSTSIRFDLTPVEQYRNYLNFPVVEKSASLADENQYQIVGLFGRLPKGIHTINVYLKPYLSGEKHMLLYSFKLDFSNGNGRYGMMYNDKIKK